MRVLVADDSAVVRDRLVVMLSEVCGVDVVGTAADGLEAIDSFRRLRPDIVVLDIRMPKANGIQVLEEIKEIDRSAVVLMLTNYLYPQYRTRCMAAGADYFLDKSTEFDRIPELLAELRHAGKGGGGSGETSEEPT